jgi:hypothetical protein
MSRAGWQGRPDAVEKQLVGQRRRYGSPARSPTVEWLDVDPAGLSPVVLVAAGFFTTRSWYRPIASALRTRGAAEVVTAAVDPLDWVLCAVRGLGPVTTRVGRALLRPGEASAADPASRGAPVLLVGHSARGCATGQPSRKRKGCGMIGTWSGIPLRNLRGHASSASRRSQLIPG